MNKKGKKIALLKYIVLLILISLLFLEISYSKYVDEKKQETVYRGTDFYLESSMLQNSITVPIYTYEKGINTITVDLNNYIDELRFSEVSINYEVSITDTNGNAVTDKNDKPIMEKTGTLSKLSKKTENITFDNLKSGTYVVTAKSLGPYSKTIKANFIITENDNSIEYTVNDSVDSNILQLTVSTKDYNGNIKISWPEGLLPNSTDPKLAGINTGSSAGNVIISFNANSEYTFQFFKNNPNIKFEKNQFTVQTQ